MHGKAAENLGKSGDDERDLAWSFRSGWKYNRTKSLVDRPERAPRPTTASIDQQLLSTTHRHLPSSPRADVHAYTVRGDQRLKCTFFALIEPRRAADDRIISD
jgi:hypothetical protein